MNNLSNEICAYLSGIDKLSEKQYKRLISIYGTEIVNNCIEFMISQSENNIHKFDYYVELMTADVDSFWNKSNLEIYMQDIGKIPRLSHEESYIYASEVYGIINKLRNLFEKIDCVYEKKNCVFYNSISDEVQFYLKECLDEKIILEIEKLYKRFMYIRDKLVEGNIRVVVAASKLHFKDVNSFLEIIQYGNIGLMKAVEKYNPNFNTKFVTYSYYWIRQSIRIYMKYEFSNGMIISYNALEKNNEITRVISMLTSELGRKPTDEEISSYVGISIKRLDEIRGAFKDSVLLSSFVFNGEDCVVTYADIVEDKNINIEEEVSLMMLRLELMRVMEEHLNDMQRFVLMNRFSFSGKNLTFEQIGEIYGVTKQYICQVENRALIKLRRLAGDKLRGYLE